MLDAEVVMRRALLVFILLLVGLVGGEAIIVRSQAPSAPSGTPSGSAHIPIFTIDACTLCSQPSALLTAMYTPAKSAPTLHPYNTYPDEDLLLNVPKTGLGFPAGVYKPPRVCLPQPEPEITLTALDETSQLMLEETRQAVEPIISPLCGYIGIYASDLAGNALTINGQVPLDAASLIKLPTILTLYTEAEAGRLSLDTPYTLQEEDTVSWSGWLSEQPVGFTLTYRDMARLMGQESDNTAFHILADKVLGAERIQAVIDQLGMSQTSFIERLTTPQDIAHLLERLYQGQVVTDQTRDEMLSYLVHTSNEERIPAGIPQDVTVAHKIGTADGLVSDAGIILAARPFILVVMTQETFEDEALYAIQDIAGMLYTAWEQ